MAHEFLQAFQALDVRLRNFQKAALEAWVQEYRGDLGIALTDVVGMDAFYVILICILPNSLMAYVMTVVTL
jgi:nicotinic acid phosphoribosyltransferase